MLRNKLIFYTLLLVGVDCISETEIPELVNRRLSGDIYGGYNSSTMFNSCNEGNNLTYLVHERQCVDQQDLLNGCDFYVAPNEEFANLTTTLAITDRQGLLTIATTVNSVSMLTDAIIVHRGTYQSVNGSFCLISNLEVYRGREQIIEIESDGFSLNERSFIEINSTKLAYDPLEYPGELYRMNLSCSGGGLPESGCLVFKVIGQTNVTNAKFNNRVPGTLYGGEEGATTTAGTSPTESVSGSSTSTTQQVTSFITTEISNTTETTSGAGGVDTNILIYVIYAVSVVGVVALLVVVILLCAVIAYLCCSTDKSKAKRESKAAVTSNNVWREQPNQTPATVPVAVPITMTQLPPPPPQCDLNPTYTFTDSSWNEGSNV